MKVIIKRDHIMGVLDRWKHQYRGEQWIGTEKEEITKKLSKLDFKTASEQDIKDIIGNWGWTRLQCSECGENCEELVEFEEQSYCKGCLIKGYNLFKYKTMKCFIDGDHLCITKDDFINLQESDAVFVSLNEKDIERIEELMEE